uniref:Retrotransposon gag domain-containing protein n=1 Tax=Chromera velia CCMP2878 TaxID=1169474 RepID=A0A0G4G4Y8_9ALVE|eukprot:Cvel_20243.t1-p1 / transcript=Cvel_20243.t1 / gene=Cvel_20243 / organism=Chromera_velia_CCMP2878 / gene_product=hypothetical protein / transcript_product=hypothetical protein / location=Cvel_scaffold1804:6593-7522(-) / protein_length=310 / sequence_SO=supercontig / SO=protein_coding / is_pseudo=false
MPPGNASAKAKAKAQAKAKNNPAAAKAKAKAKAKCQPKAKAAPPQGPNPEMPEAHPEQQNRLPNPEEEPQQQEQQQDVEMINAENPQPAHNYQNPNPPAAGPQENSAQPRQSQGLSVVDPRVLIELQKQGITFKIDEHGDLYPASQGGNRPQTGGWNDSSLKIKTDLPTFSGERAQTITYWTRITRLYERMGWNFSDFRDIHFPSTLTAKAKVWYDQLPLTDLLRFNNINELEDQFMQEFALTAEDRDSTEEKLFTLKQKLTESLEDFASRYRNLCIESGKNANSSQAMRYFFKGLNEGMVRVTLRAKNS